MIVSIDNKSNKDTKTRKPKDKDGWRWRIFRMWVVLCDAFKSWVFECWKKYQACYDVDSDGSLDPFFTENNLCLHLYLQERVPWMIFLCFFLAFASCNSRFVYVWAGFLLLLPLLRNSAAIHHYVCLGNCWQLATWMEGRWSIGGCARLSAWRISPLPTCRYIVEKNAFTSNQYIAAVPSALFRGCKFYKEQLCRKKSTPLLRRLYPIAPITGLRNIICHY